MKDKVSLYPRHRPKFQTHYVILMWMLRVLTILIALRVIRIETAGASRRLPHP